MTPSELARLREQFKALAERKMHALAAKYEGEARQLRRYLRDPQMELLMEWRAALEQPAGRRA